MNASLRDLQLRFAASLHVVGAAPGTSVYRNTIASNYRNALGATYRVVQQLVGDAFFNAAVDGFAAAHPSTSGDLNVYGGQFAEFLADYPHASGLPYLPDVARLEWALDEASRAADVDDRREAILAALGALSVDDLLDCRLDIDPSCRFLHSKFPVMRIWQAHQGSGSFEIDFDGPADSLLIRREGDTPMIERVSSAEYAWLVSLDQGDSLRNAVERGFEADDTFDLGNALARHIVHRTVTGIARGCD